MSLWTILAFALGYLVRHLDILRFHVPANPLMQAVQGAQMAQQKQAEADLLAKLQTVQQPASPPPAAGS